LSTSEETKNTAVFSGTYLIIQNPQQNNIIDIYLIREGSFFKTNGVGNVLKDTPALIDRNNGESQDKHTKIGSITPKFDARIN